MKKLISSVLLLMLMPMMLVSCFGDDDNKSNSLPTYPTNLLGYWEIESVEVTGDKVESSGTEPEEVLDYSKFCMELDENYIVHVWYRENEEEIFKQTALGMWYYEEGAMRMQFQKISSQVASEIYTAKVSLLDANMMILEFVKEIKMESSTEVKKQYTTVVFNRFQNTNSAAS